MKIKHLFLMALLCLACNIAFSQVLSHDTIQYVGKKDYKTGNEKTHWVSRIILCPDSTYKKGDYYYSVDKHKTNHSNVEPVLESGYWILKGKYIYFYSSKPFIGPEFKAKYKVQKNSIIFEWRFLNKKNKSTKNLANKNGPKIKIGGVKPIIKFNIVKVSK
jgi:hypothetical protein